MLLAGSHYELVSSAHAACDATCQAEFVTQHNRVRTRVNNGQMPAPAGFQPVATPPLGGLTWDATIAAGAQAWSDACNFVHSGAAGLGENLDASAGTTPSPTASVANWESESTAYTYAAIGDPVNNFSAVGHYTQLVWANTTLVGCGVTHCTVNSPFGAGFPVWDYTVCRYSPPGNFSGQFPYATGGGGGTQFPLDIDFNNAFGPNTDGLLVIRYLFGLTGTSLTNGALGAGATVTDPAAILTWLTNHRAQFDVDGNGQTDAMTDGVLIIRYLLNLRGAALTTGALGAGATRDAGQIATYIQSLTQ
jgi:hypothetical protein